MWWNAEFGWPSVWIIDNLLNKMATLADQSVHGSPFIERTVVFARKPPAVGMLDHEEIQVVDSAVGTERSPICVRERSSAFLR
jgi:hypothetical protein